MSGIFYMRIVKRLGHDVKFILLLVRRTRTRQAVQLGFEPRVKSHSGSSLAATQQTYADSSVGLRDLTMTKATRNERIHNAVRRHQYKLREVGDHFGFGYSTISVIAKRVDESNKS